MKTNATNDLPEIEWEMLDVLEYDREERMVVYNATGVDANGNKYSGSAHYYSGEFEDVKDIELAHA